MFNVSPVGIIPELLKNYFHSNPLCNPITTYALDYLNYYALPIAALSCGYIFRKRILRVLNHVANEAREYLSSIFYKSIKISDNNCHIHQILDREFQASIAKIEQEHAYSKKGREDYQFPASFYGLTQQGQEYKKIRALEVIPPKMKTHISSERLKVLDLGTGNGTFIYGLSNLYPTQVEAHGISALDTRNEAMVNSENVQYFVGNVERLFHSTPIKRNYYDVIFSSFCFMHLTDPIIALINAYDALKEGGELFIDHFIIRGLNVENLRRRLHQKGYKFDLVGSNENIDYIHLIKNKPTLDLPIIYKRPLKGDSERQFMQYAWYS